jgi:nitronate monooxygenase
MDTALTRHARIEVPLICGAMYPCSNWELVAAVSAAGGIGIVQPISLVYAHKMDFREGLRKIRSVTDKPIGFNVITEQSSQIYLDRMKRWLDIALEEGVRYFVTSLGNPRWIVERVKPVGGVVYHDVTERKWAQKAVDAGVDGLIAVNDRAGGHAGAKSAAQLLDELAPLGLPVVGAGGVGSAQDFVGMLRMGYAGVQMGTRFIATTECNSHPDYKQAIVQARADQIVLTEKISGVPVAVIETPYVKKMGTHAGPIARQLLRHPRTKHWMRTFYSLTSLWKLRKSMREGAGYQEYFQAGKSVEGVERIEPAGEVVRRFAEAAHAAGL